MASWEDWEEEAAKPVVPVKKENKFGDEEDEAVPIEGKQEAIIKSQPQNQAKLEKKEKQAKLEKKWDDKEKEINEKRGPLTAEERKKAEQLSKESDARVAQDLFEGFIEKNEGQNLKTEQAFVDYAKKIAEILVKEDRKKYIQEFMKELLQQLYPKLSSAEYEDIHSKCTTLFNQKQKDEKGPLQKKKTNPKVNASKANANKLMGFDDSDEDQDQGYTGGGGRFDNDDFM